MNGMYYISHLNIPIINSNNLTITRLEISCEISQTSPIPSVILLATKESLKRREEKKQGGLFVHDRSKPARYSKVSTSG